MVASGPGHNYVPLAARLFNVLEDEYGWQSMQVEQFAQTLLMFAQRTQHRRAMQYINERVAEAREEGNREMPRWMVHMGW